MLNNFLKCLLLVFIAEILCAYEPTKSFSLSKNLVNRKATVTLGNVVCDFKFSTQECSEKKIETKKSTDYASYLSKLQIQGYWEYRICIGDKTRQFHQNDEYLLGKYNMAKDYKDTQVYDDGQKCPSGARQTKVRYMCGVSKGISSIIEPSECHYEMTVVHPSLCGAGSPFEVFSGQINSEIKSTDDHYFMSLEKSVGGNYVCTVNIILREMKEKADVCFSKFALQISSSKKRTITMKQVEIRIKIDKK
eukprot:gene780-9030_t